MHLFIWLFHNNLWKDLDCSNACPERCWLWEYGLRFTYSSLQPTKATFLTLCAKRPQGIAGKSQRHSRMFLHFRGTQQYLMSVRHKKIITLKNIHSFNITLCDIPFNDVMSLRSWISWSCCDKKQVASRNQYERGNKEGNIQSDPKDWEAVQCMRGTSIQSLVYKCGYLRLK